MNTYSVYVQFDSVQRYLSVTFGTKHKKHGEGIPDLTVRITPIHVTAY